MQKRFQVDPDATLLKLVEKLEDLARQAEVLDAEIEYVLKRMAETVQYLESLSHSAPMN